MAEFVRRTALAASESTIEDVERSVTERPVVERNDAESHSNHRPRGTPALEMSPRQEQVLGLLAQGLTDKEVAQKLEISHRTVQTHMKNFLVKNGIRTRLEAVATWSCQVCRSNQLPDRQ